MRPSHLIWSRNQTHNYTF